VNLLSLANVFQLDSIRELQTALHFLMDLLVFRKPVHVQLGEHLVSIKEDFEPPVPVRFKLKVRYISLV